MSKQSFTVHIGQFQYKEISIEHGQIVIRRKDRTDGCTYGIERLSIEDAQNYAMAINEAILEAAVVDAEKSWKVPA